MRKDIFSSTRRNIIIMSLGIVMGTLLIFAILTQAIYKENLFDEVDRQLSTHKNMVINDAHIQENGENQGDIILPSPLVRELINYVWKEGQLVKDSPHPYKGEHPYPQFPGDVMNKMVSIEDGPYHYRGIQFEVKGYTVQLLLSTDALIDSLANLQKALFIAFLVLVIIGFVVAFYLAKIALKPLAKAYHKQAAFIQDASHEMRTPLAVIKGKLELIVRRPQDCIEAHYDEFSGIMSELSGLEKLNKDLLLLSKEDMSGILEVKKISLQTLFSEITDFYSEICLFHDLHFEYQGVIENIEVEWDQVKVKRCISILLENAIKYSSPDERVSLKVVPEEKYVRVEVLDTGRGIREEEMEHIFDRFYRSNEVRASGIEGSGIGLSLLQSLAYTMGIKIKVESKYGVGSHFMLWIPRYMASRREEKISIRE
ncbi:MAG: HAMP domain-containing histidine kinase [Cellulosilyticum sp.]|nr:HAMP domain-containing histidine kinase [Cellulosilyticum sp.]